MEHLKGHTGIWTCACCRYRIEWRQLSSSYTQVSRAEWSLASSSCRMSSCRVTYSRWCCLPTLLLWRSSGRVFTCLWVTSVHRVRRQEFHWVHPFTNFFSIHSAFCKISQANNFQLVTDMAIRTRNCFEVSKIKQKLNTVMSPFIFNTLETFSLSVF